MLLRDVNTQGCSKICVINTGCIIEYLHITEVSKHQTPKVNDVKKKNFDVEFLTSRTNNLSEFYMIITRRTNLLVVLKRSLSLKISFISQFKIYSNQKQNKTQLHSNSYYNQIKLYLNSILYNPTGIVQQHLCCC